MSHARCVPSPSIDHRKTTRCRPLWRRSHQPPHQSARCDRSNGSAFRDTSAAQRRLAPPRSDGAQRNARQCAESGSRLFYASLWRLRTRHREVLRSTPARCVAHSIVLWRTRPGTESKRRRAMRGQHRRARSAACGGTRRMIGPCSGRLRKRGRCSAPLPRRRSWSRPQRRKRCRYPPRLPQVAAHLSRQRQNCSLGRSQRCRTSRRIARPLPTADRRPRHRAISVTPRPSRTVSRLCSTSRLWSS